MQLRDGMQPENGLIFNIFQLVLIDYVLLGYDTYTCSYHFFSC
jgi:hypothetical protein